MASEEDLEIPEWVIKLNKLLIHKNKKNTDKISWQMYQSS